MRGHVLAVIGAQYGSEGKGVVVSHLASRYKVHVRVGAPNAGHSFWYMGRVWKQQSIPVGWRNPEAKLVIGRGALVNPTIFERELDAIEQVDAKIGSRIFIDKRAGVLDEHFHEEEGGIHGEIHQRIGSTGEGVGAARVARINRDPANFRHMEDLVEDPKWRHLWRRVNIVDDTPGMLRADIDNGDDVLLEGAQGSGLSLIHGPWPYVTSTDCNSAQLAADVGIPPRFIDQCVAVVRVYPIRVAGNSGPLRNETNWAEISRRTGHQVEEKTTVTLKTRRVGSWDDNLVDGAITLNAPTSIALTFMDYLCPSAEGITEESDLPLLARQFTEYVERRFRTPVSLVGTGGDGWQVVERSTKL